MKSTWLFIVLFAAIAVSLFFTYERSFATRDFEIFNSEEYEEGEETEVLEGESEDAPVEAEESVELEAEA
jgi:hypothetical protein